MKIMLTAKIGMYFVRWDQTELDGLPNAPRDALKIGAAWTWRGPARPIESLNHKTLIEKIGVVGNEPDARGAQPKHTEVLLSDRLFLPVAGYIFVSNGAQNYGLKLIQLTANDLPIVLFHKERPPADDELWVADHVDSRLEKPVDAPRCTLQLRHAI